MPEHNGIVACSAEGAAFCDRTIYVADAHWQPNRNKSVVGTEGPFVGTELPIGTFAFTVNLGG